MSITGGTFAVTDSYEGFESKNILLGGNATTYVYASDDSWNASDGTEDSCNDCYVRVSGGKHYSIGFGDGLDSNYGMEITGGIVLAAQSGGGNGIFDLGGGNMNVTGNAVVLGVGTSDMTVCPTATTSMKANGTYAQGSIVAISNGSTLVGAIKLPFSAAQIQYAYSSGSYTVTTGGSFNGTYEFNYFATSGSVSGGSAVSGSTCSNSGGMGGGGMGGGGRW